MRFPQGSFVRGSVAGLCALLLMSGCATRSISDSGYPDKSNGYGRPAGVQYRGELTEFNVLGIQPTAVVTEEAIREALDKRERMTLAKNSPVMLVQSGALIPDEAMVTAFSQYYRPIVFSGVPEEGQGKTNYAGHLRLAAARSGSEKLMVYWGILESGRENMSTKVVSWVPILGALVPDENQHMRIRLKVALVDVRTGQWEMFSPEPFKDVDFSSRGSRATVDQAQVAMLKEKAYRAAVTQLFYKFSS
ncbi:hypothetical protein [Massilia scottii]|uniref:hypothetical protein n=1 Tax=Massilia scottii TaxID=3057166 RepID=UPI00279671D2|nr:MULTISPECIES: hypothetical protein [unclassified Massilia]MDQ1812468.1 hypothetical protein [Massilia sp. CCM 9210]MDQ1829238.1 hypothetical protein [Massilia sp. CCM 9029]